MRSVPQDVWGAGDDARRRRLYHVCLLSHLHISSRTEADSDIQQQGNEERRYTPKDLQADEDSKNVARAWTNETAVMCGVRLPEDLPYNQ